MAVGSGGDVLFDERRAILVLDRSELGGLAITDYNVVWRLCKCGSAALQSEVVSHESFSHEDVN